MRWIILLLSMASFTTGCASVHATQTDTEKAIVNLAATTPEFVQGQPITNPEIASTLAELVLAQQGVDTRDRSVNLSFFEGVYRVVFTKGPPENQDDYTVEIGAADSSIIRVSRSHPLRS